MIKLHREKLFGVFQHIDIYTFVAGYIKDKKNMHYVVHLKLRQCYVSNKYIMEKINSIIWKKREAHTKI